MGKKCQVCGGPIVNGRCKYCGMPYRNDMELYHLNEDRSEHYRHSSAKVRKAMAESEIPLPDRNKTTKKPEKKASVRTTQKTIQKPKKKEGRASKKFWRLILVLIAAAGLLAEQWDTIEYRIEEFIYDTFDISLDFGSLFGDSNAYETGENDGDETVKFDKPEHKEKVELHTGDEVSTVASDGQENFLIMYQIRQYDE